MKHVEAKIKAEQKRLDFEVEIEKLKLQCDYDDEASSCADSRSERRSRRREMKASQENTFRWLQHTEASRQAAALEADIDHEHAARHGEVIADAERPARAAATGRAGPACAAPHTLASHKAARRDFAARGEYHTATGAYTAIPAAVNQKHDRAANIIAVEPVPDTSAANAALGAGAAPMTTTAGPDAFMLHARASMLRTLPKFDGSHKEWPIFAALFDQGSSMCGFSDVDNLVRLQQSLTGPARESVRALLLDPSNVPEIRRALERRFGRPGARIEALMEEARRTAAIGVSDSIYKLVEFGTTVCNVVHSLKNMGHSAYLTNPPLLKELVLKLPQHLRLQWYSVGHGEHPTLVDFGNWLENIVEAASHEEPTPQTSQKYLNNHPKNNKFPQNKHVHTTDASDTPIKCTKCNKENHPTPKCRNLLSLSLNDRWAWVKKERICTLCLKRGHVQRNCTIKSPCGINNCKWPHHQILHRSDNSKPELKPKPESEGSSKNSVEQTQAVANTWDNSSCMLLRVAPVELKGPKGAVCVLALFDEGSSITLIQENIANKIGAEGPESPLNLIGASGMCVESRSTRKINCEIRPINGQQFFKLSAARTVNNLDLPTQKYSSDAMKTRWPHLKNVPLKNQDGRPEILIGIDHWDLIIPRTIIAGPANAPIATSCRLGWTLGGGGSQWIRQKPNQSYESQIRPESRCNDSGVFRYRGTRPVLSRA